jgi:hypothetical protein
MKGRNNNNSHGNQKRQKKAQKAHEVQGKRKACARVCLCEKKKKTLGKKSECAGVAHLSLRMDCKRTCRHRPCPFVVLAKKSREQALGPRVVIHSSPRGLRFTTDRLCDNLRKGEREKRTHSQTNGKEEKLPHSPLTTFPGGRLVLLWCFAERLLFFESFSPFFFYTR